MSGLILRSEVDVAADTLVALLATGLVASDLRTVARALQETGLDSADLDAARLRWERHYWQPPHRQIAQDTPPLHESRITNHAAIGGILNGAPVPRAPRPSEAARARAVQPEPGWRTCQGPCNRTLHVRQFDRHGSGYKARCRSCDPLPRLTPCAYCGTLLECACGR